jgi:hypothetical protein
MISEIHSLFVALHMFLSTVVKRMFPAHTVDPGLFQPLKGSFVPYVSLQQSGQMLQASSAPLCSRDKHW